MKSKEKRKNSVPCQQLRGKWKRRTQTSKRKTRRVSWDKGEMTFNKKEVAEKLNTKKTENNIA